MKNSRSVRKFENSHVDVERSLYYIVVFYLIVRIVIGDGMIGEKKLAADETLSYVTSRIVKSEKCVKFHVFFNT